MKIILSIVGEHLDPDHVSHVLGGQPRTAGRKGDTIQAENPTGKRVARPALAGFWQRGKSVPIEAAADAALHDLFTDLSENDEVWFDLNRQFRTEVALCGAPPHATARQIFSDDGLALLQRRHLELRVNH
jgi:hypothetical protein